MVHWILLVLPGINDLLRQLRHDNKREQAGNAPECLAERPRRQNSIPNS